MSSNWLVEPLAQVQVELNIVLDTWNYNVTKKHRRLGSPLFIAQGFQTVFRTIT